MDLHDFYTGRTFDAHRFFGAHFEGDFVTFRTYAPCIRQENTPPCPSRAMGIPCQPLNSPISSTACAPGA